MNTLLIIFITQSSSKQNATSICGRDHSFRKVTSEQSKLKQNSNYDKERLLNFTYIIGRSFAFLLLPHDNLCWVAMFYLEALVA